MLLCNYIIINKKKHVWFKHKYACTIHDYTIKYM